MVEGKIGTTSIECVVGDIARQPDVDAIVNAANAELQTGGGVAGAIHRAAGPELGEICRPLAPIQPGEAVITPAPNLPNKYIIHCLGPIYGRDEPSERLLAECYRNALQRGEENRIASIAFPAISAGAFGYPLEEATETAVATLAGEIPHAAHLRLVRFVLFKESDREVYRRVLKRFVETTGDH